MPSSKSLIGGAAYDIKNGRTSICGTGYDIKKGRTLIGGTGYDIKFTVPLGELAEGDVITIKENGNPVEFFTAKQNYESELNGVGRVLLVRKSCLDELWAVSSGSSYIAFQSSAVCTKLNGDYLNRFSSIVQAAISTTTFVSGPKSNTCTKGIFLLSATEIGYEYNDSSDEVSALTYVEGTKLSISDSLVPSKQTQWTRSITRMYRGSYAAIYTSGAFGRVLQSTELAVCPCFTLPATMEVDSNLELIEV